MGKSIKSREARQRTADLAVNAILQSHSKDKAQSRAAAGSEVAAFVTRIGAFRGYALRAPEDWRCRIKSRSDDRRFLDFVRFCFGKYRVPLHLETAWLVECDDDFVDRVAPVPANGRTLRNSAELRRWYLVATQGGSLYKMHTSAFLSKQETHHFLTVPCTVRTTRQALWYAVARGQTERNAIASKISETKLGTFSIASSFWKDVARFFARHSISVHETNDLIDYLRMAKTEDDSFSLKGRTLESLQQRKEDWHRALRKLDVIGGGSWAGRDLPDAEYETGSDRHPAIWRFRQIRTGNELYREGQRMRHCVVTYKGSCLTGDISIWSVCSEYPVGQVNRGVTLEIRKDGAIVQCRGFANRLPFPNEVTMVKRWACEHDLSWQCPEG